MDTCCYCGKTFAQKGKGYDRKSLQARVKLNTIDKTIKEVIEDEFGITLTPELKSQRFLCAACSWTMVSMSKSRHTTEEAEKKLKQTAHGTSYLAKKLRSPLPTPRKIKRMRFFSPQKIQTPLEHEKESSSLPTTSKAATVRKKMVSSREADVGTALRYLGRRQYQRGVKLLMKSRVGFQKAVYASVQQVVRDELRMIENSKTSSFRGGKTLEAISQFQWKDKIQELQNQCPVLLSLLVAALTSKSSARYMGLPLRRNVSVNPSVGTLMSIILYQRKPRTMSDFQEMNGIQMWLAGSKREMFARFNSLGLCVGIKGTRNSIDRIRKTYDNEVFQWKAVISDFLLIPSDPSTEGTIPYAEGEDISEETVEMLSEDSISEITQTSPMAVSPPPQLQPTNDTSSMSSKSQHKGRYGFSICFDNVNQRVTVRHQTKDKSNKMFNMVQAYAAMDRIPSLHLSDEDPAPEQLLQIPLSKYLPSDIDEIDLRAEMTTLTTRILCSNFPFLEHLKSKINWHIHHPYSMESAGKSVMVPLGVLDKDESRVADTIDILEEYQQYLPHKPDGSPLKLPLHADGLSCERGNDAQSARINGNSAWTQLQGFTMNIQEWHKRNILLQDIFDDLFKGSSSREKGTLFQLKNYFNHRNVSSNVKETFNYDEEFLDFCCNGYILLAAVHLMNIDTVSEKPTDFPSTQEEQLRYLNKMASEIIDMCFITYQPTVRKIIIENGEEEEEVKEQIQYCICKRDIPGSSMIFCENRNCERGIWFHLECLDMEEEDVPDGKWYCCEKCKGDKGKKKKKAKKSVAENLADGKKNYALRVLWHGLNQKVRRDAIRENDGERIIMHWRFDMLEFFEKHHPKYFLVCHRLLSAVSGAASDRLRHTLTWNRTVNPTGGKGKNIAMDLQMEFYNKEYKESVKDAAGHLTTATVARHSQMVGVGKILKKVYEKQVSELPGSMIHKSSEVDRSKDLKQFVQHLKPEHLFVSQPKRCHATFPDVDLNLFPNVLPKAVRARLERLRKEMSKRKTIINQMQRQ